MRRAAVPYRDSFLLEKETPFYFSKECIEAFNTLKKNLTEAPILIAPDWNEPFELMCSDGQAQRMLGAVAVRHVEKSDLNADVPDLCGKKLPVLEFLFKSFTSSASFLGIQDRRYYNENSKKRAKTNKSKAIRSGKGQKYKSHQMEEIDFSEGLKMPEV
ncbi:hypothetical protein Tco_1081898 [Tanacetum coccineum]|uniref:Reverse transcriptase/retrotransposon-derived protein RNase H-like domain-containing protein n=1 Tax=Tanacetum coccineum TaxID=301880 RepID=A0ABQ5I0W6_9ASTR